MIYDFTIKHLGKNIYNSPCKTIKQMPDNVDCYISDDRKIIYEVDVDKTKYKQNLDQQGLIELAGPREKLFFNPEKTRAAILTCGGLCPGLNDVIRSVVMSLWYTYGVRTIFGIKNGLAGFLKENNRPPVQLTPADVADIHLSGGTALGSSRGGRDRVQDIANAIQNMQFDIIFFIGGDGTQKAAKEISDELLSRKAQVAIVGIPKTIDNDLSFVEKSFGFETAVSKAVEAIISAHTEARDAINGIGIVKVMGRESGFIAANSVIAQSDVNFVLVPEAAFDLEGPNGLFKHVESRLKARNHAVILVAEGAGQNLLPSTQETDASGNKKLNDIGLFLVEKTKAYFKKQQMEINLKYIDPSYIIRSAAANPNDSLYCNRLGNYAVHAAMAGKTSLLIGRINNHFVHIPAELAISRRNTINIYGPLWQTVIESTGQPFLMKNDNK